MSKVLVLNMGMKSIRSIIFDRGGNKLASASLPIVTQLEEEWVTQDPVEWWEKGCAVIKETLEDVDCQSVSYVTVTTSSSCMVAVDRNLIPLAPCMMVSDRRAARESEYLKGCKSYPEVYASTGLPMDPYLMLPKALWIKNNLPDVFGKADCLMCPNDFLIAKLSGVKVTDSINAQKWHYDTEGASYPASLMEEAGIPTAMLPRVESPGTCIGTISERASAETGLSTKTKVILSTYDAICAFIGSGAKDDGEACDISGTVTVFRAASKEKADPRHMAGIQQIAFDGAGIYILGGSNNMGGGLIEWAKQCYYHNEELPYERMEKEAREAGLGAGGLVFIPYLMGERAPIWDYEARGVYFGLERTHTRKEMTRAVLESTGFIDLDMIKAIESAGKEIGIIRVSGGLARISLVSQIKADVTGREVHVLEEFETTAAGAAMIAFLGQKEFRDLGEAADSFARVRMIIKPNLANHKKYSRLYKLYKETYYTLKPLFAKRIEMMGELTRNRRTRIENL